MTEKPGRETVPLHAHPGTEQAAVAGLVASIVAQCAAAMGRPERVVEDCRRLRALLPASPADWPLPELEPLFPLPAAKSTEFAAPVCALIEEAAAAIASPWPFFDALLAARDPDLAGRALDLLARRARDASLAIEPERLRRLAARVEAEGSPLVTPCALDALGAILAAARPAPAHVADAAQTFFFEAADPLVRRLAARVLDRSGEPAPRETAIRALGAEAFAFLHPYLEFTRASHRDLLELASSPGVVPSLASLQRAEALAGESVLREVIARLGWPHLNLGLEVDAQVAIALPGTFPFLVAREEAPYFAALAGVEPVRELTLFIAHGGTTGAEGATEDSGGTVARFRGYNLAHAEALADILDLAPLTREKSVRILDRMDRIVEDFTALFARHSDECARLPDAYRELRGRVTAELDRDDGDTTLSTELTRLVQMFEDPRSLDEVRTLHGLKRYLHQRGLRLGFRLVETSRATNRRVHILLADPDGLRRECPEIRYVDFEPPVSEGESQIPFPVRVAVEGFSRQLMRGQSAFPGLSVFCYGNEVHYYLAFGNHPAFLRIDYSPPLQGGMIDLEYFGVSKSELNQHPDPELTALRACFRRLDFDVQVESTHVRARYDKERALDLGAICEKAGALFRLAPHLMDVDWAVGGLRLSADARGKVAEAWADFLARWGSLPSDRFLTGDRQGILVGLVRAPGGPRELVWSGEGAYQDRFSSPFPPEAWARWQEAIRGLGLERPVSVPDVDRRYAQLRFEHEFLTPLRAAKARGQIVAEEGTHRRAAADRFRLEHEAEIFARLLAGPSAALTGAIALARLVSPLERTLRFQTTGVVNGHEVQRARLPLRGEDIGLFVLRGPRGIIRLALYSRDGVLWSRREDAGSPWTFSGETDAAVLAALLRANGYPPLPFDGSAVDAEDTEDLRRRLRRLDPAPRLRSLSGERVVTGLRASPGRAVGPARLGMGGRSPRDFAGAILVTPRVGPEDNAFLFSAAAIVSTGGGILSHAGLLAIQFRKPALIVPGRWSVEADGAPTLSLPCLEYGEEEREVEGSRVVLRTDLQEREHSLREGDLVAVDAAAGTLRVLGRGPEALALHDGLCRLEDARRRLAGDRPDEDILVLRGHRLKARHQLAKLVARFTDPALARHTVDELLLREPRLDDPDRVPETAALLAALLANPVVGARAREHAAALTEDLDRRRQALVSRSAFRIPTSRSAYEVLQLRLDALRLSEAFRAARELLPSAESAGVGSGADAADLDALALEQLRRLLAGRLRTLRDRSFDDAGRPRRRHLLREAERLAKVCGGSEGTRRRLHAARAGLAQEDDARVRSLSTRRVLGAPDGGLELLPLVGGKAANLAEIERLAGSHVVPPWFAVTHHAFEEMLASPVAVRAAGLESLIAGAHTLHEAIESILGHSELGIAQRAAAIRLLWDQSRLPEDLAAEILEACAKILAVPGDDQPLPGFVAIRSSSREEDAEAAARAGEFDTFLFVRGEAAVLDHLKRAWSGLWSERAIHNRAVLESSTEKAGGGIVVQRMIFSRVAGVVQTVNVAENEPREFVINAGLGLGEGVVSGAVAADQIVVAREGDLEKGPLRFRYATADKTERVVLNREAGLGTRREETLYHQRLRPALEYVELCELVRAAARLEEAYGYPLDLEFGIEGTRLWILQARPVAVFHALLRETLDRRPLAPRSRSRIPRAHEEIAS